MSISEIFHRLREESGQTLVEYSLIVSIMAIAMVATLAFVGDTVVAFFITTGELVADSID